MSGISRSLIILWTLCALLAGSAPTAPAAPPQAPGAAPATSPPPAKAPLSRPIFENPLVRVTEVVWEPGAETGPAKVQDDTLAIVFRGGTMEHRLARGKTESRERKVGEVIWQRGNAALEPRKNTGSTKIHMIQVRLFGRQAAAEAVKKGVPKASFNGPVAGANKVLDNARVAVFEQTLPPNGKVPAHAYGHRVWVILDGGEMRSTDKNGKNQFARFGPSQVLWLEGHEQALENIGKSTLRWISVELK